jgi:hypothetical protein
MRALASAVSGRDPMAKDRVHLIETFIPSVPQARRQLRLFGDTMMMSNPHRNTQPEFFSTTPISWGVVSQFNQIGLIIPPFWLKSSLVAQ